MTINSSSPIGKYSLPPLPGHSLPAAAVLATLHHHGIRLVRGRSGESTPRKISAGVRPLMPSGNHPIVPPGIALDRPGVVSLLHHLACLGAPAGAYDLDRLTAEAADLASLPKNLATSHCLNLIDPGRLDWERKFWAVESRRGWTDKKFADEAYLYGVSRTIWGRTESLLLPMTSPQTAFTLYRWAESAGPLLLRELRAFLYEFQGKEWIKKEGGLWNITPKGEEARIAFESEVEDHLSGIAGSREIPDDLTTGHLLAHHRPAFWEAFGEPVQSLLQDIRNRGFLDGSHRERWERARRAYQLHNTNILFGPSSLIISLEESGALSSDDKDSIRKIHSRKHMARFAALTGLDDEGMEQPILEFSRAEKVEGVDHERDDLIFVNRGSEFPIPRDGHLLIPAPTPLRETRVKGPRRKKILGPRSY